MAPAAKAAARPPQRARRLHLAAKVGMPPRPGPAAGAGRSSRWGRRPGSGPHRGDRGHPQAPVCCWQHLRAHAAHLQAPESSHRAQAAKSRRIETPSPAAQAWGQGMALATAQQCV